MVMEDRIDSASEQMSYMCPAPPPLPPPPAPPPPEEPEQTRENLICRDYLRNSCTRPMCRFTHSVEGTLPKDKVNFCHDFQNGKCNRTNCKFIHCAMEEEDEFYRTGKLPATVIQRFNARVQVHHQMGDPSEPPPPPPPPTRPMDVGYQSNALPPLPPQSCVTYAVPPPPPPPLAHDQWMPQMQREEMEYGVDLSRHRATKRRYGEDGSVSETPIHCTNCSKFLQMINEYEEKLAALAAKCNRLSEENESHKKKNGNLERTVDLLLDKSTKLMNMFTGQGGTPQTSGSVAPQTILSSAASALTSIAEQVRQVPRIAHLLNASSSGSELVMASIPSSIRRDVISTPLLVSGPAYKTPTMRHPFNANGCVDGTVYSTATLGEGLVESGQQLIMTPRCDEMQRPILTSQAILPNNPMVLSTSQLQIIPVSQSSIMNSAGNLLENTMVISARPQQIANGNPSLIITTLAQQMNPSICGTSQSISLAGNQPVMPYFPSNYAHSNKS